MASAVARASEEQRHRIAMDLHDGPAQELAYLLCAARQLRAERPDERLDQIIEAGQRALDELRLVIEVGADARGTLLDALLTDIAERITTRADVQLLVSGDREITVSNAAADALGRIVREAVNNAVVHGQPRTVSLDLRAGDRLHLTIADDGAGFDVVSGRRRNGVGLTSMRERADRIGAQLRVESTLGRGTRVDVVLPADAKAVEA